MRKTPEIDALTTLLVPPSDAIAITFDADDTMLLITTFGRQPSLFAKTYAWMANLPTAKIANVSAPDALSFATCDCTSEAFVAYGSAAITFTFDRCNPRFRPFKRSLP